MNYFIMLMFVTTLNNEPINIFKGSELYNTREECIEAAPAERDAFGIRWYESTRIPVKITPVCTDQETFQQWLETRANEVDGIGV